MNIDVKLREKLIGLTLEVAAKLVESDGYTIRTRFRNGQPLMGTSDFKTNRINVAVNNDIITDVTGIG